MNFGQLIEFNMKKIFLKNHIQNVIEKIFQDIYGVYILRININ